MADKHPRHINTIKPTRTPPEHQEAHVRAKNFNEVTIGYNEELALQEADRCMQCTKPACSRGCPVGIDIRGFIDLVSRRDYRGAYSLITEANLFPAICGRVCPQELQCEANCVVGKKLQPVAIGLLEKFVGDTAQANGWKNYHEITTNGKKAAIVGSGPAGLACASDLAKAGVKVVVFEALHLPGGVLMYGIPEFRLPKSVVLREIDNLKDLGVTIKTNKVIGKLHTITELLDKHAYDAVFVASGAGYPMGLGVKGELLNGVMSANEFLTRVNLMHGYDFPHHDTPVGIGRNIAVIGCGNTAMDAARVAIRLNTKNVYIVYRRSMKDSPARREELKHAVEEGVQFYWETHPVEILASADGWLTGMKCISGGEDFILDVDTVIYALGTMANPIIARSTPTLRTDAKGYIVVDHQTQMTSIPGVFAGGDISKAPGSFTTVIHAMQTGRRAAQGILNYIAQKTDK
ncbi:NADPH-dependent glutamate synthase [Candidatus Magnetobacterium casense]|uniref:NADPH-dependent glutamate synthase n=1 Tax=Candidatus Magnetobacterium casense TaxID=1455061 RepID=UPI00058C8FDD|nr:NADPH-dependent glutamate synthase [Candidatus Magnetobacterium casensis]